MKRIGKILKRLFVLGTTLTIVLAITAFASVYHVKSSAKKHLYSQIEKIPANNVGVVLGTSKYGRIGGINPYFKYRMEAAYKLYKAGKIKHIIVSGDNHIDGYNEPQQMKEYLMKLGVLAKDITLDYAGLRTFDSIIRAREIFGQTTYTIISQKFHNERAVFIARKNNMKAIGYNAATPVMSKRMRVREFLAKVKAVLDIYVLKTKPKFLGEKIEIEL